LRFATETSLEIAAKRQDIAEKQESAARLQELRNSDPQAYLAELKAAGDSRWEFELQALDPQRYEIFVAERHRNEEAARKLEITGLLDELKTVPPTDPKKLLALYSRLSTLDPTNPAYKSKRDGLARKAEIAELLAELKTIPATDINRIHTIYLNLTALDPTNKEYRKKREAIAKQHAQVACASGPWPGSLGARSRCLLSTLSMRSVA
jgi:hypothetical protein